MAPRNTKHGASASSRRTSHAGSSRATSSARSRSASQASKARTSTAARTKSTSRSTAARSARGVASARKTTGAKKTATRRQDGSRITVPSLPAGWVVPCAVAASLFVLGWTFYPVAAMQYRETRERSQLSHELASLRERNDRLRREVDKLKTPAGVEDYARSQLGFVKKGENVVVVVDDEALESSSSVTPTRIDSDETTVAPAGAWTAFLDLVFGVK